MAGERADGVGQAAHFRRLIETQPSCLMRIGTEDGRLLAINDTALRLLEVEQLGQALGSAITTRIAPPQQGAWTEFMARVSNGTPGSFECELINASGGRRTVVFNGIPLPDHPDAIPSMLVAVQDTSVLARLTETLGETECDRERLRAEHATELTRLSAQYQEDLRAQAEDSKRALDELRGQLQEAMALREQLEAQIAERDMRQGRLIAEHEAEQIAVERVLAAAAVKRERARKELADALVERESLVQHAQRLAPLVAAGRVGLQIARDLRTVTAAVETRAAQLLAQCPPQADVRTDIEILRNETLWANALAGQIVQAHSEAESRALPDATSPSTSPDSDCPVLPWQE